MLEQWDLLEASFAATYPDDLDQAWSVRSWRWFQTRVTGLLATDTPLARHFAHESKE